MIINNPMLLCDYCRTFDWYMPYIEEIFSRVSIKDVVIDEEELLLNECDTALAFTTKFCQKIYDILLEENNKQDIYIYLTSLRLASYNPDKILEIIVNKEPEYFINNSVYFLLLFSRDNLFKYKTLRRIYEMWINEE